MAQELQTRAAGPIGELRSQLEERASEFKAALPSHISLDKFQRVLVTAVQGDPALLEADRRSLILSAMKCAQDGLLPDKREAALVIFSTSKKVGGNWVKTKEVQYMPMVYGLRKKILQSGEVVDLQVGVVYAAEVERGMFHYEIGVMPPLQHRPDLSLSGEEADDGNLIVAYSIATLGDGTKSYEVMRRFEIDKVRQTSQTGAVGKIDRFTKKAVLPKGPWVDWFAEMAKKTVLRRHSKTLPMSGDIFLDSEERDDDRRVENIRQALAVEPDAPVPITDQSENETAAENEITHDPDTGEIIEESQSDDVPAFDRLMAAFDDALSGEEVKAANDEWVACQASLTPSQNAEIEGAFDKACAGLKISAMTFEPLPSPKAKTEHGSDAPKPASDDPGPQPEEVGNEADTKAAVEDAMAAIRRCATVIDVNSRVSEMMAEFGDDDFQQIRELAMDRIAELKGVKQ